MCRHGQTQNKATLAARVVVQADPDMADDRHITEDTALPVKRGRGRPPGSKNVNKGPGGTAAAGAEKQWSRYTRASALAFAAKVACAIVPQPPTLLGPATPPRGNGDQAQACNGKAPLTAQEAHPGPSSPSLSIRSDATREEGSPDGRGYMVGEYLQNTLYKAGVGTPRGWKQYGTYESDNTPESTRSKTVSQTAAEEAASEEACSGNCCGRGCSGRGLNQSAAMWKMHLQRKRLPGKEGAPEKLQTLLSSRQCRPHQAPVRLDPTSPCTFLPAPLLTHLPTQHPSLAECHVSNSLL